MQNINADIYENIRAKKLYSHIYWNLSGNIDWDIGYEIVVYFTDKFTEIKTSLRIIESGYFMVMSVLEKQAQHEHDILKIKADQFWW